jgi:hypothetical protein
MGNKTTRQVISTAAPAAVAISTVSTSFVYEDLISHVQGLQEQIIEITKFLDDRWKNGKKKRNEFKSRSLTFVDPFGNSIVNQYMDHEIIHTIIKNYKKDYVPKYLQKWIKIGIRDGKGISPLTDCQMKSTVSEYPDGHQFITYGEVTVWTTNSDVFYPQKLVLAVLTDNMLKIKMHLKQRQQFSNIELKSIIINKDTQPNNESWNHGNVLKLDDTIMSSQLYQDNCIIMAKLTKANVTYFDFSSFKLI